MHNHDDPIDLHLMKIFIYFNITIIVKQFTIRNILRRYCFLQCGSILFAQLEIWKVNSMEDTHLEVNNLLCDSNTQSTTSIDVSDGMYIFAKYTSLINIFIHFENQTRL